MVGILVAFLFDSVVSAGLLTLGQFEIACHPHSTINHTSSQGVLKGLGRTKFQDAKGSKVFSSVLVQAFLSDLVD